MLFRSGQEQKFLIGVRVLTGSLSVTEAGAAYTRLAETLIADLFERVTTEFERAHGRIDGGAAAIVARAVLTHGLPPRTFININAPSGTPKGLRVTTQAKRNHVTKIDARTDPRGNAYYWIEEALDEYHPNGGMSDHEAVREGYVSVTPLQPDMTDHSFLEKMGGYIK